MENKEKCSHKNCGSACGYQVDTKALQKSKDDKKKIVDGNKIVKK